MKKIAAVIVTFNRKNLLVETIRGVLSQTRRVDKIYIVDNASTDQTFLAIEDLLDGNHVSYHRLERNTGGAGGFSHGMGLALNEGFDWCWTMDDDVEPRPDALEVMLKYSEISECINARKIFTKNGETQYWEQYYDFATNRLIDLKNVSFANGKDWCPTNVACFEGMLVSARIVEKIGLPDSDYFIYQDDTVFGVKASFYTNVIYVRDAIFDKKIYGYGAATPLRAYYFVRNSFKLKRDVFLTGLVGKPTKLTNVLFLINIVFSSLVMLKENFSWSIFSALRRGFIDGYKGV